MPSLLSKTWPITSCICWVQAGDVWALHMLHFCLCPLLMCLPWFGDLFAYSAIHLWLLMARAIFLFPILYGLLPLGARLFWIVGLSSFSLLFYLFRSLAAISCRTTLSFLLWCYLTQACWAFLSLLLILLSMTQYSHWIHTHAILGFFITLLVGSFFSFISSWASLAHLLSLGIPSPFSNFAFSWVFTNSFGLA